MTLATAFHNPLPSKCWEQDWSFFVVLITLHLPGPGFTWPEVNNTNLGRAGLGGGLLGHLPLNPGRGWLGPQRSSCIGGRLDRSRAQVARLSPAEVARRVSNGVPDRPKLRIVALQPREAMPMSTSRTSHFPVASATRQLRRRNDGSRSRGSDSGRRRAARSVKVTVGYQAMVASTTAPARVARVDSGSR